MRIGSLVVCTDNSLYQDYTQIITPALDPTVYTVRAIGGCNCGCKDVLLRLEEIKNEKHPKWGEPTYYAKHFKEVQTPGEVDLSELLKQEVSV